MPEPKDPWSPAEREAQGREAVRNLAAWPEPERVYALHPGPAPRFAAEEQGYGRVAMPPYPDDKGPPIRMTYRNRLSREA